MPDYSTHTYQQTKDQLKTSGAEIGSFNQDTFRKQLAFPVIATIGNASLAGGYCNGVLLDWVRRVLLSGTARDEAFLTFHSGALAKGQGTDKRTHEELQGRASQTVQRMGHGWDRSGDMDWVGLKNQPTAVSQEEWKRTASAIDEEFVKQRAGANREPSKKDFGRLELKASRKTTYQDASQWMGTLMLGGTFIPGYCTCVGFSEGKSAHSVAIWRRRESQDANDSFYFFDPNYGVYSYKKLWLKKAMQYLFWKDAVDTPKYPNCTRAADQMMCYMTFGPPNLVG